MNNLRISKNLDRYSWLSTLIFVSLSILIFWLIATNRSPNFLRPLSMILRTGYTIVVPLLFCSLYFAYRLNGWVGRLLSLSLTVSIFALALAGVWADGRTEAWLLSGIIPMFDATNYYIDAMRLLAGMPFSEYSANKPLFPALFAVLFWIANRNLLYSLIYLTLLVALGCYLLAAEIKRTHGPATAAFALLIIFIYYRIHSGIIRTENLGVLFSVLGMALLWRGVAEHKRFLFLSGTFMTSLALIARPGPMFILPAISIWGAFFYRSKGKILSWKFLLTAGAAILTAFLANLLLFWTLGAKDGLPFGRFPYALYGLVSGGHSWAYILEIKPNASETEIYKMSFELFREEPALLLKGILYNLSMFTSNTGYGLYSYMRGERDITASISYWVLIGLSIVGIITWIRKQTAPYMGLLIAAAIGLFFSVPFLPPTDAFRLRLYAGSIVVLAIIPALGLHATLAYLGLAMPAPAGHGSPMKLNGLSTTHYSALVIILVFLIPFVVRGIEPPPKVNVISCSNDEISLLVRYNTSSMIHLYPQNIQFLDWTPDIHIGTFRRNVHDFPSFEFMDWALETVEPNTTMFYALDYRTNKDVLVVVESDLLPTPPAHLQLCGKWEQAYDVNNFSIFYPFSVIKYE